MDVIITKGEKEDTEIIVQFQVDMAMESEGRKLDKDTVAKGVSAAMNLGTWQGIYLCEFFTNLFLRSVQARPPLAPEA